MIKTEMKGTLDSEVLLRHSLSMNFGHILKSHTMLQGSVFFLTVHILFKREKSEEFGCFDSEQEQSVPVITQCVKQLLMQLVVIMMRNQCSIVKLFHTYLKMGTCEGEVHLQGSEKEEKLECFQITSN